MGEFWLDLGRWFGAVLRHWYTTVGGSLVAVFQLCYSLKYRESPPMTGWVIVGACFVVAMFLAWRGEYRKSCSESLYSIVSKIVDLVPKYYSVRHFPRPAKHDLLGALIHYADQAKSEKDVVRICRRLEELDHGDPFKVMYLIFKPKSLRRKKLKIIRDAHQSGRDLREDIRIIDYARAWAEKNGIEEHCFPKPSS